MKKRKERQSTGIEVMRANIYIILSLWSVILVQGRVLRTTPSSKLLFNTSLVKRYTNNNLLLSELMRSRVNRRRFLCVCGTISFVQGAHLWQSFGLSSLV
jgi:hypothetical protein